MNTDKFERTRHIRYFTNCLQSLPEQYTAADTNRLTLVHFCVQSLDILGCLPTHPNCCGNVDEEVILDNQAIIEWIYGLQTIPTLTENNDDDSATYIGGGFKGGTYLGDIASCRKDDIDCPQQYSIVEGEEEVGQHPYDHSHLAMTYVAICTLLALGDDLSRVHKTAILQTLQSLQKEDGSFMAISSNNCNNEQNEEKEDDDCDLRFLYTAISIWYLLKSTDSDNDDNPIINIETATNYILSCITWDGSLGLTPGREGHGGSTFCGIASLFLMSVLDDVMNREELKGWKDDLIRWCVSRQYTLHETIYSNTIEHDGSTNQVAGMCGRPNKLEDTCYSYWVGGTLHLLNEAHLLDGWALRDYVLSCQSTYGGFGKLVGAMPDVLHSFYSLAWLSLSVEQGCCEEEEEEEEEDEYVNDIDNDDKGNEQTSKAYNNERRRQVDESLHQLPRLDCALGICSKRIHALQKRQER